MSTERAGKCHSQALMSHFERSWRSAEVPEDWKKANTTQNYWAVSHTSIPGQVTEHFILEAISLHMDDKNMTRNSQHGFTKGKSCLTNPITFYEEGTTWMGEGGAVDIVNFSKASGTVSHEILTGKLKKRTLHEWIENWLNSRC